MNASYILHADLLDIIFENRNKAYGAYTLRKFYDQHVLKSLGIITILLSVFTLIFFTSKHTQAIITDKMVDITPGRVQADVQLPTPKEKATSGKEDKSMSNKFVFVDSLQKVDSLLADDDHLSNTGSVDEGAVPLFSGSGSGGDGPPVEVPMPAAPPNVKPVVDILTPLEKADIDPAFPGGMKALTKFLERNLENPAEINEGEAVSVKVKFVVGFDGLLKAFEIKEDGGAEFNKEVIRVLKKMPRWIPGKANGQDVSVYFTIPVKFINGQ